MRLWISLKDEAKRQVLISSIDTPLINSIDLDYSCRQLMFLFLYSKLGNQSRSINEIIIPTTSSKNLTIICPS